MKGCGRKIGPFDCCTIVAGDCLDVMPEMPERCVDLIVTDPPFLSLFGTSQNFRDNYTTLRALGHVMASGFKQVLDKDGLVYLFCDWRAYPGFWYGALPYLKPIQLVVWAHYSARRFSKHRFCHQLILVLANEAWKRKAPGGHDYDIWEEPNIKASERVHDTQKPGAIIKRAIEAASERGELVFDGFVGSGQTAIEAANLDRHFFGCDINPEYVEMARRRLSTVQLGMNL